MLSGATSNDSLLCRAARDLRAGLASEPSEARLPAWRWIAEHFRTKDANTGKAVPYVVFPWYARVLLDLFPDDGSSDLPYSLGVISTTKKGGKTTLNGAIAAYLAFARAPAASELYVFANSQEQSVGRVFAAVKYAVDMSQALRDMCAVRLETSIRLRNGTTVKAQAAMHANIAGSNPYYSGWCVDQETEALTRRGFKLVVDLTTEDELATLNPESGRLEWHSPRLVNVTPYRGPMVRFEHRRADFLVTPNHRVLGRFVTHSRYSQKARERGWWFEEATTAASFAHGWLKADADWVGESAYDPLFARLVGYYVAEGSIRSRNTVAISQRQAANPDVYESIRDTVERLGYSHTCGPEGIIIKDSALAEYLRPLGCAVAKFVPEALKDSGRGELTEFFEAYMQGDGWRPTSRSAGWQCCTVSPRLADDLMEIGLKLGYQPRLMSVQPGDGSRRAMYRLSFSVGPVAWSRAYAGKKTGSWSMVDYDGLVACPSVPHGIFYIRRNGKCVWTGNTELWGYQHPSEQRAWDEMTPPPTVRNAIRVVDTYAGYEGESTLLNGIEDRLKAGERLYDDGYTLPGEYMDYARAVVAASPELEPFMMPNDRKGTGELIYDTPLPCYVDAAGRAYGLWDEGEQARRMPWQQGERGRQYYREQEENLLPGSFQRFHMNRRAKRGGQYVPVMDWQMLEACDPWDESDHHPVVLAVDAATHDDHMALVGVRRVGGVPEECYVRVWEPRPDARAKGRAVIAPSDALSELVRLRDAGMRIAAVAYDPYQFHDVALKAASEGFNMVEFPQGGRRALADTYLRQLITSGGLRHTHAAALGAAVEGADAIEDKGRTGDEKKVRIVKGAGKVDPLVALSMAVWTAMEGVAGEDPHPLPEGSDVKDWMAVTDMPHMYDEGDAQEDWDDLDGAFVGV